MPFQYCEVKGYSVSGFSFDTLEKSHSLNLDFWHLFVYHSQSGKQSRASIFSIIEIRLCSLDLISLCLVPFLCTSNCKLMVRSVYLPTYENDFLAQQLPLYFLPPVHFIQKELFSWRGQFAYQSLEFLLVLIQLGFLLESVDFGTTLRTWNEFKSFIFWAFIRSIVFISRQSMGHLIYLDYSKKRLPLCN